MTQPPPAIDIDQLRELAAEASPGKWLDYGDYIGTTECGPVVGREGGEFHNADQSDIDLIVAMRNSFEALLQELAELRAMKLAAHGLAAARVNERDAASEPENWDHDMREIERLTR